MIANEPEIKPNVLDIGANPLELNLI